VLVAGVSGGLAAAGDGEVKADVTYRGVTVRARQHPIDPVPVREVRVPFRRQWLRTIVVKYSGFDADRCLVWLNGNPVDVTELGHVRVRAGDVVITAPRVAGPVAALVWAGLQFAGSTLAAIGSIQVLGTTVGAIAITTAIGYGISWGVQALTRKDSPAPPGAPESNNTYGFGNQTTQAAGLPYPLVFGRMRLQGNLIGFYTDVVDNVEVRHCLVSFGYGLPFGGVVDDTLEINDQPSENLESVTYEYRLGGLDQTALADWAVHPVEYHHNRQVDFGETVTLTTLYADYDSLRVRHVGEDGVWYEEPIPIRVEISEHGAESWSTLVEESLINDNDDVQRTLYDSNESYTGGSPATITRGTRYDIRVTNSAAFDAEGSQLVELALAAIAEVHETAFVHPGETVMAVRIGNAEEIGGSPMKISAIWDGCICYRTDETLGWSRNPADVILTLILLPLVDQVDAESGAIAGALPSGALPPGALPGGALPGALEIAWEVVSWRGRDPATIGNYSEFLGQLQALAARCDEPVNDGLGGTRPRFTFGGKFDAQTDAWEAIAKVAAVCDCEVRPWGNGYRLYVDEPWTGEITDLYAAGNIVAGTYRESEVKAIDKAGEIEMEIRSELDGYEVVPVPYTGELQGSPLKTFSVSGFGITHPAQASRKVARLANHNDLVEYVNSFEVALSGLNTELNRVIYVVDPTRRDGRGEGADGAVVTLDAEPVASGSDVLALTTHDAATGANKVEVRTVLGVTGPRVTLDQTPAVTPRSEHTVYAFGPASIVQKKWRVKGVRRMDHNGDDGPYVTFEVQCEEYFDGLYPGDDFEPDF
jgi:hypothetical protein